MTQSKAISERATKFKEKIHITEQEDEQATDGRPQRDQARYALGQLPALIRHLPTFLWKRQIKQVNPKKHYVWLFDNIAFRASSADKDELAASTPSEDSMDSDNPFFKMISHDKDPWQVEYVAAFFKRKGSREIGDSVARLCRELNVEESSLPDDRIRCRIQHFVDSVLPRHVIHTSAGHRVRHLHGPSSSSGIALTSSTLPTRSLHSNLVTNTFPGAKEAKCFLPGTTIFAEPEGWGVISDIDDTIKITMTASPLGVLSTTFLEEARPVSGMPQLYSSLDKMLDNPAFFYVSASPYNLYPFLRQFRTDHFPLGPIMLRESTWQNLGGLIGSLVEDVQKYKLDRIRKIHSWFPKRKFVLIGDSTHKDPETYADIVRTYPGWVTAVFIRRVTGLSDVANPHQQEKNSDARFAKAFEGIDEYMWFVFDEPEEVEQIVEQLVAQSASE